MLKRLHTLSCNYFNGITNSENTLLNSLSGSPNISESLSLTDNQSPQSINISQSTPSLIFNKKSSSLNVSQNGPSSSQVSSGSEASESSPRTFSRKRKVSYHTLQV